MIDINVTAEIGTRGANRARAGRFRHVPARLVLVTILAAAFNLTKAQAQDQAAPAANAQPSDLVQCPIMGARIARAVCEDATATRGTFRRGVGGFTPPTLIFRDEEQYVTFAVTRNPQTTPVETLLEGSAVSKDSLDTYRQMDAHLIGTGFRVEPVPVVEGGTTGEARDFGAGDGQVWRWRVTAVDAPSHRLTIAAFILFPVKDGGTRGDKLQPVLSHQYDIPVRVTFTQRLGDALTASGTWLQDGQNWLKIFAGFLAALGTAWVAVRNLKPAKRREERAEA